jgi:ribosomal protection tetracycline resistance protein
MTQYVADSLASGVYGWQVTDCVVTLTECEHAVADGPPSKRGSTSASDFKELTPLVLHRAVERAGTVVCEPMLRAHVELPTEAVGALTAAVARLAGTVDSTTLQGGSAELSAVLPAARIHELQRRLPGLTHGEGVLDTEFAGYRPVAGDPPRRNSRP